MALLLLVVVSEATAMKRTFLLAIAACAILLPSTPLNAKTVDAGRTVVRRDSAPAVARVRHRSRGHRRWHFSPSIHWGWGRSWGWGGPYGYGYYGYYGYPYPGYHRRPYGYYPSPDWAAIDTDVSPEEAQVYLDGTLIGLADDFDGYPDYLYLKRGRYRLEFRVEGYEPKTIQIDSRPGMKLRVDEDLRKVPGAKRYGSYESPRPEGGVRRFWGKRRNVSEEITDEEEISGGSREYRDRGRDRDEDEEDEEKVESRREELPSSRRPDNWRSDGKERREKREESARENSRLRLRVEPADAAVYLDDRFIGTAEEINSLPRGISVSSGKHTVTVSRPGFRDHAVDVELGEGETEELKVSLKR